MTRPAPQPATGPPAPPPVTAPPTPVNVRAFGLSDRGQVRTSNEDNFLVAELARTLWVRQTSLPQPQTHYGRNRGPIAHSSDGGRDCVGDASCE